MVVGEVFSLVWLYLILLSFQHFRRAYFVFFPGVLKGLRLRGLVAVLSYDIFFLDGLRKYTLLHINVSSLWVIEAGCNVDGRRLKCLCNPQHCNKIWSVVVAEH